MSGPRFKAAEIIQQSEDGLGFTVQTQHNDGSKPVSEAPKLSLAEQLHQRAAFAEVDEDELLTSTHLPGFTQDDIDYINQQNAEKKKAYEEMRQKEKAIQDEFAKKQAKQLQQLEKAQGLDPFADGRHDDGLKPIGFGSTKTSSKFTKVLKRPLSSEISADSLNVVESSPIATGSDAPQIQHNKDYDKVVNPPKRQRHDIASTTGDLQDQSVQLPAAEPLSSEPTSIVQDGNLPPAASFFSYGDDEDDEEEEEEENEQQELNGHITSAKNAGSDDPT